VDTKKFGTILGIPDTDVVQGTSSKDIRVTIWEANIIDSIWMSSVPDFGLELIGIDPVNVGLVCTSEEMSKVLSESK